MIDEPLVKAWREAAADLGIRVEAPFAFVTTDGRAGHAEAHVLNFGSPSGAMAMSLSRHPDLSLDYPGHWCSGLGNTYSTYNRQSYIDMLNDWGWFGERGKEPDWYRSRHG